MSPASKPQARWLLARVKEGVELQVLTPSRYSKEVSDAELGATLAVGGGTTGGPP